MEDQDMVAAGLEAGIKSGGGVTTTRAASLHEALTGPYPDVVLLDVGLPDTCRLTTVKQMRREWTSIPILVITAQLDTEVALWILRQGAMGIVDKAIRPAALLQAIASVDRGEHYLVPETAAEILQRPRADDLSLIQRQVLALIAEGHDCASIAHHLGFSRRFVAASLGEGIMDIAPQELTESEMKALYAISFGLPNKTAARRLGVKKVNNSLTSLRLKLGVPSGAGVRALDFAVNRLHWGCHLNLESHLAMFDYPSVPRASE